MPFPPPPIFFSQLEKFLIAVGDYDCTEAASNAAKSHFRKLSAAGSSEQGTSLDGNNETDFNGKYSTH